MNLPCTNFQTKLCSPIERVCSIYTSTCKYKRIKIATLISCTRVFPEKNKWRKWVTESWSSMVRLTEHWRTEGKSRLCYSSAFRARGWNVGGCLYKETGQRENMQEGPQCLGEREKCKEKSFPLSQVLNLILKECGTVAYIFKHEYALLILWNE